MKQALQILLVVDAIFLVTLILLQTRGASLSSTFGGSDSSVNYQRRGSEKAIHYVTIVVAIIFVSTAFAILFV